MLHCFFRELRSNSNTRVHERKQKCSLQIQVRPVNKADLKYQLCTHFFSWGPVLFCSAEQVPFKSHSTASNPFVVLIKAQIEITIAQEILFAKGFCLVSEAVALYVNILTAY
jgi:hypothetical protein